MENRRSFLKKSLVGSGLLIAGGFPFKALANQSLKLTILHTNDVHSRLEPFPVTDKNFPGMGGVAARAQLIQQIRAAESNVLLLDAGDMFQGTPYFNIYQGEAEIKAMNMLKYDAGTLGNHEFDLGIDNLATQLQKANFPILNANYDVSKTPLKSVVKPYQIIKKGGLKIGIFGLGVQLYGLVAKEAYGKIWYNDPIKVGNEISKLLRQKHKCDLIICLSHLGYEYNYDKVSDVKLAAQSSDIDIIIGGHTHTLLEQAVTVPNAKNNPVIINQVGWGGVHLGRLDLIYTSGNKIYLSKSNTVEIGKQTRG